MPVNLGDEVKDKITGFAGIAVMRVTYLHGCVHVYVEPTKLNDEGSPIPMEGFDEQRIDVINAGAITIDFGDDGDGDDFDKLADHLTLNQYLGSRFVDSINGFEGICIAVSESISGEIKLGIEPEELTSEGSGKPARYINVGRLELVEQMAPEVSTDSDRATSGGPAPKRSRLG